MRTMNTPDYKIKVAGIDIRIHWTFSLIILYIIYINIKAGQDFYEVGWSVLFVLTLFFCVTLHELGHALAAKRYGIKTRDITIYPIGGVARLEKMPEKPMQELIVAFAGPLVNVVIMLLLLPFIYNFQFQTNENEKVLIIGAANFLPMLGMVNMWLALFNLIPAFPMDGGRVLRALLTMRTDRLQATQTAAGIAKVVAIGFVILGFYLNPFLIFIGLFIILGAHAEEEMVKNQFYISDLKASDALMTNFPRIDRNKTIADAVKILLDGEAKCILVVDEGNPYGILSRDHIIKGISRYGESGELDLITERNLIFSEMDTSLSVVFQLFQESRSPFILVRRGEVFKGIIDAENIAELILIKNARSHPEK